MSGAAGPRLSRLEAVVLGLLADAPAHAYALRARLAPGLPREQQPKEGVVYPLLARLERRGLVTSDERERRRVYACTTAGEEAFLGWLRGAAQDEPAGVDAALFLDQPFLKLLFAGRLTPAERAAKLDAVERVARERLAALDRLAELRPTGPVGDVLLDVGRAHEEAVLDAAARLRDALT